jgi:hypothetical protein
MEITREVFEAQYRPRFGTANPERMLVPFWEWMIRGDPDPDPAPGEGVLGELGLVMREGILRSTYGPWRVRDLFDAPPSRTAGPIWTFDRMGQTRTELPDGRLVCIGGEHEDSYDPDFNTYNDVVVFESTGEIEIYGYPKDVFPPTDFHTATLAGDRIVIIGCLGYPADRRPGYTPVHALNLGDYRVAPVASSGESPGWIWNHAAELTDGTITVRGGEVVEDRGGKEHFRHNFEDYTLDLATGVWRRVTNRNWAQWRVRRADGKWFEIDPLLRPEAVVPVSVPCEVLPCEEEWHRARGAVEGVALELTVTHRAVEVVIEGQLPHPRADRLLKEIRSRAETATGQACVLEQV